MQKNIFILPLFTFSAVAYIWCSLLLLNGAKTNTRAILLAFVETIQINISLWKWTFSCTYQASPSKDRLCVHGGCSAEDQGCDNCAEIHFPAK